MDRQTFETINLSGRPWRSARISSGSIGWFTDTMANAVKARSLDSEPRPVMLHQMDQSSETMDPRIRWATFAAVQPTVQLPRVTPQSGSRLNPIRPRRHRFGSSRETAHGPSSASRESRRCAKKNRRLSSTTSQCPRAANPRVKATNRSCRSEKRRVLLNNT